MEIFHEFTVEAAHELPAVPENHPCRHMHGHAYRIEVHIEGPVDEQVGWVADYAEISDAFEPLRRQLDHRVLNEVEGLSNPTSENLARWVWKRLRPTLPGLRCIIVRETDRTGCVYRGG